MRIKTQFRIAVLLFCIILAVVIASMMMTSRQVERTDQQERVANDIARGADELGYLANDYLLYGESQQLKRWQARFAAFSATVAALRPERPEERALVRNIEVNQQRLKEVFDTLPSVAPDPSRKQGMAPDPEFLQVSWSRMAIQIQGLVSDASHLSELLRADADRSKETNVVVIFALVGVFAAYFLINYLVIQRRTLTSIATLQEGAAIIGSGNLGFVIEERKE